MLIVLAACQIAAKKFHPCLYWATIIASTTAGTTLADFCDRSLGIGYLGGSLLLLACVLGSLAIWYRTEGTVSVNTVNTHTLPPSKIEKGPEAPFQFWRRGWDSNPRTPVEMLLEFQSSAFDRSATSPVKTGLAARGRCHKGGA